MYEGVGFKMIFLLVCLIFETGFLCVATAFLEFAL